MKKTVSITGVVQGEKERGSLHHFFLYCCLIAIRICADVSDWCIQVLSGFGFDVDVDALHIGAAAVTFYSFLSWHNEYMN